MLDSVVICNISPGNVRTEFLISCLDARDNGAQFVFIVTNGYLDDGRNSAIQRFINETDREWMLFVDSDIEFTTEQIKRLVASADRKERPVVSGIYFSAVGEPSTPAQPWRVVPLVYYWDETHRKMDPVDENWILGKVGLHEADGAGAGFLLIHREFLALMAQEFASRESLPWFSEPLVNGVHFGEDLAFFIRVQQLGYKLWMNTDVRVAHHKTQRLSG